MCKAGPEHVEREELVHNGGLTFGVYKGMVRESFLEEGEGEAFDGTYPRKSRESMIQEQRMGSPAEPGAGKGRGLVEHREALRTRGAEARVGTPPHLISFHAPDPPLTIEHQDCRIHSVPLSDGLLR